MAGVQLQVGATWKAGVVVLLAGLAMSAGCREEAPAMRAVKNASNRINAVAGGAEAAVGLDVQEKAFREALKDLGEVKLDPSNPMIAATGVLTAASQLGAAGVPSDAAQASLSRLAMLRGELRSVAAQWSSVTAVADAAVYDPAPRLAELDKQLTSTRGEMAQANERLAKVQADQDKMLAAARDKADQAAKYEQESVKLKEEARKLSAKDSQPVLARALEAKSRCDELKLAVSTTEADATLLEPRKLEVKQKIQELEINVKSLEAERARVVKRGEDAAAVEKEARAKADSAGKAVERLAKDIAEEREKNLLPAIDQVAAACRAAQSAAASAKGDGKNLTSRVLTARAKQRLGEVLLVKAGEAAEQAALLKDISGLKPAVPGAAGLAEAAKAAAEAADAARGEAKTALEGARSDYKGLPTKSEADEAAKATLLKYLTRAGGLEPDEAEAAPAGDKNVEKAGDKPADKPADGGDAAAAEIKDFLASVQKSLESGDTSVFAKSVVVDGASADDLKPIFGIMEGQAKLAAACKSKFGKTLNDAAKEQGAGGGAMAGMTASPADVDLANAKVEVTGDTATVRVEGKSPAKLKKVDGAWKIDLSDDFGKPGAKEQLAMIAAPVAKIMSDLAADVEAGKFEKVEDVAKAMMERMMQTLMPKNPGGDKGSGGG
jgi:hypothetical protein